MLGGVVGGLDDGQAPDGELVILNEQGEPVPMGEGLQRRFGQMWAAHRDSFTEAEMHRAMYDGDQYTSFVMRSLIQQGLPAPVINIVGQSIDNMSGRERSMRLKPDLLPRHSGAKVLSDGYERLLEYHRERTKAPWVFSDAFLDELQGPGGWTHVYFDDSDPTKGPHFVTRVPPELLLADPAWRSEDVEDANDLCHLVPAKLAWAVHQYPQHADLLKSQVNSELGEQGGPGMYGATIGGDYDNIPGLQTTTWAPWGAAGLGPLSRGWCDPASGTILLRQHWWWEPERATFARLPDGTAFELRRDDPELMAAFEQALAKGAVMVEGQVRRYRWALCVGPVVLDTGDSPYWHRRFPYVWWQAFRDRYGEPYGIIRRMYWPQREVNTAHLRKNEAGRSRWAIVRKGSMTPYEYQQFQLALARGNFTVQVNSIGDLRIESDKQDAAMWSAFEEQAIAYVDQVAGQNEANYGNASNEKSGEAIKARAAQAATNQGMLFDNARRAQQRSYELLLSNIVQTTTREMAQRVIGQANAGTPFNQVDVMRFGAEVGASVLAALSFDVIMSDQVESQTQQQQTQENTERLVGMLPDELRVMAIPLLLRENGFEGSEQLEKLATSWLASKGLAPNGQQNAVPVGQDPATTMQQGGELIGSEESMLGGLPPLEATSQPMPSDSVEPLAPAETV